MVSDLSRSILQINTAFIGTGATGRVIRVHRLSENEKLSERVRRVDILALKMVQAKHANLLEAEFKILKNHQSSDCGLIVRLAEEKLICGSLCGLLLTPIGIGHVQREHAWANVEKVLRHLIFLHTHNPTGIIHGDARLLNLIHREADGYFWIDLRTYSNNGINIDDDVCGRQDDMHTLIVRSILGVEKTAWPGDLLDLIVEYSKKPCQFTINLLSQSVEAFIFRLGLVKGRESKDDGSNIKEIEKS
jgi:hypothetical protein